jgi:predicted HAD superfamily Cof-like phosphohydrolase
MTISDIQAMVREFHGKFGLTIGDKPALRESQLRADLIAEEADEFDTATCVCSDLPDAVDAICDLIYVAVGAAVAFGVDLEPHFRAVHESNMRKVGGGKRDDGKLLKPAGWSPPDISGILKAQGWGGQ